MVSPITVGSAIGLYILCNVSVGSSKIAFVDSSHCQVSILNSLTALGFSRISLSSLSCGPILTLMPLLPLIQLWMVPFLHLEC